MNAGDTKAILDELQALKKLMILALLEKGFTQKQLGLALGVNQATVSRMFPVGTLNRRGKGGTGEAD